MVISISISDVIQVQGELMQIQNEQPKLYQRLVELVQLTRQLSVDYQYFGKQLIGKSSHESAEVPYHIIELYKREIDAFKENQESASVLEFFSANEGIGFRAICKLILGVKPEKLVGPEVL